ncbi:MAG: hypothetical protein KDA52_01035, partial [Planctomycetaceae bacterium]|nr:hypothetical protein [Planctomycetaceae bacterium]
NRCDASDQRLNSIDEQSCESTNNEHGYRALGKVSVSDPSVTASLNKASSQPLRANPHTARGVWTISHALSMCESAPVSIRHVSS